MIAVSALLATSLAVPARAETINCTPITTLPAVISTQGIYCLTGNLATNITSGNAITITANNVTLDLNGWKLGGQGGGMATQAAGILSGADNVTIKNGIVRGFYYGIYLTGRGGVVQDMLMDQNTHIGIAVFGQGSIVEHNQVVDTGGSTAEPSVTAIGIETALGSGSLVVNNVVSGLTATGGLDEYGIAMTGLNSVARDNIVNDDAGPTGGGTSLGIFQYQSDSITVNNTVSNFAWGIYNTAAGIYAHNTVNNCTTSYYGGVAGVGNSP